jgi:glycosyltransferase involved in cell wall biosynthesis
VIARVGALGTKQERLAFVISSLGLGGAERDLSVCANFWASEEKEVCIFAFTSSKNPPVYPLDARVRLCFLKDHFLAERFCASLRRFLCMVALRHALRAFRPHVIISYVDITNILTLLVSRGLGAPVIVAERSDPFMYKIGRFCDALRRRTYRWARKVVVQTPTVASYFPRSLQKNICVIPNGVRSPSKHCTIRKNVRFLVSSGRLDADKGFDLLLESCVQLFPSHPSLQLTLYGEGPYRVFLEQKIRAYKVEDRVSLPGATTEIEEMLARADLFAFPSRHEGFPNALCEAMAVGLPVVASNCLGNRTLVRDGIDGLLVPVGDGAALTEKIAFLIDHPEERQRLSRNARRLPERFSEDRNRQLWKSVITEAIAESSL